MTSPDVLLLGEKDFQQLVLVRWMAADLRLNVDVCGIETRREADGLAMSSRNRYLSAEERRRAPQLYRALSEAAAAVRSGERDFATLEAHAAQALESHGFGVDYVEVRSAQDLQRPGADADNEQLIVLGAARLGKARLIDNVRV